MVTESVILTPNARKNFLALMHIICGAIMEIV
ncbi:Nodule Cysteine-Rich (NCR) secreted peptide [Medicago truncatula]|uniref:Nodule Cysteine-Rich (NCR) secreted peptide n=1 Tax=Medicago truncatula TaxID=3880 RepID=A0A072UU05_MEDTR|nr:Nodule Cysteine-Rich (NCR) secreted peptide [Medicago truncatula]